MAAGAPVTGRVGFQYVVLRAVPRVDREEFVNVGLVLYCQDRDVLACGSRLDAGRLTALYATVDLAALASALAAVESVCAGGADGGGAAATSLGQRFGWLAAPRSTVLQPGPIHGGVTADPVAELDHLLNRYVGG